MNGNFSRVTFNPQNHYSQVLMQQGRAMLDADWNEQAAIFQHALRAFICDLLGPRWGVLDGTMSALEVSSGTSATTFLTVTDASSPQILAMNFLNLQILPPLKH